MPRIPWVLEFFLKRGGYCTSAAEGRYFKRYKPLENLRSCWALTFFNWITVKPITLWLDALALEEMTESRNKLEQQRLHKASRQHRQEIHAENKITYAITLLDT